MNKKTYQAPAVQRVRLAVKNAILGNCHSSPNLSPKDGAGCNVTPNCYNAPSPVGGSPDRSSAPVRSR